MSDAPTARDRAAEVIFYATATPISSGDGYLVADALIKAGLLLQEPRNPDAVIDAAVHVMHELLPRRQPVHGWPGAEEIVDPGPAEFAAALLDAGLLTPPSPRRPIFRQRCTRCGYTSISASPADTHCTAEFGSGLDRYICGGVLSDDGPQVSWFAVCDELGISSDMPLAKIAERLALGEVAELVTDSDYPFNARAFPEDYLDGWSACVDWIKEVAQRKGRSPSGE